MFINCNKCTALVMDIDNGGGYACATAKVYGKSLVPSTTVNLKFLLKNKICFSLEAVKNIRT